MHVSTYDTIIPLPGSLCQPLLINCFLRSPVINQGALRPCSSGKLARDDVLTISSRPSGLQRHLKLSVESSPAATCQDSWMGTAEPMQHGLFWIKSLYPQALTTYVDSHGRISRIVRAPVSDEHRIRRDDRERLDPRESRVPIT
jgi:hypothetical protein